MAVWMVGMMVVLMVGYVVEKMADPMVYWKVELWVGKWVAWMAVRMVGMMVVMMVG